MSGDLSITTIVGARPQFIKAAMVSHEVRRRRDDPSAATIDEMIVHTGQHFDRGMSDVFFDEMDIPEPARHLGIAGGTHGQMTGRMLAAIEATLVEDRPDWVLVYGDTNSTLAGALAAAKLDIPVAHVEAGLRCGNRSMPEEINRILTDHASSLLLTPTASATGNLRREGFAETSVAQVGDVMFDAAVHFRALAEGLPAPARLETIEPNGYVLATVHRCGTTDDDDALRGAMEGLVRLSRTMPVVLPVHPRTRAALDRVGLTDEIDAALHVVDPVGYLDMLALEAGAALVATDSGGVQKEAFFHRVPCLILREETEWPELVDLGAGVLVGTDPDRIESTARVIIGRTIEPAGLFGDARAAAAIVDHLLEARDRTAAPPRGAPCPTG
jgi:UDP-GlcNAc3NAcA epimerase